MDMIMSALAEPVRRRMLEQLRVGELSAGALERAVGISQPAASKHLRALRKAGLVRVRKDAQHRFYAIDPAPLAALDGWLSQYRHFWAGALAALAQHLEREG